MSGSLFALFVALMVASAYGVPYLVISYWEVPTSMGWVTSSCPTDEPVVRIFTRAIYLSDTSNDQSPGMCVISSYVVNGKSQTNSPVHVQGSCATVYPWANVYSMGEFQSTCPRSARIDKYSIPYGSVSGYTSCPHKANNVTGNSTWVNVQCRDISPPSSSAFHLSSGLAMVVVILGIFCSFL